MPLFVNPISKVATVIACDLTILSHSPLRGGGFADARMNVDIVSRQQVILL